MLPLELSNSMQKIPQLFRKPILNMQPYTAPLEGRMRKDYLLLDFNERTTHPHPRVLEELSSYINKGNLQRYPEYGDLNEVIADYVGVNPQELIVTVGSDQGIDMVSRALISEGDKVVIPAPTFAMLGQLARVQGANIIAPQYKGQDYEFPFSEVMREITPGVKLVVICKPNNPTGTPVLRTQSEQIIKKALEVGAGVLSDEAYHEYAPEFSVIDLINTYSNLFITRTFSKTMGIPSLRAGMVVSQRQNIEELKKIRGPYDVGMPTVVALKSLTHKEVREDIRKYVDEVMHVSKPMIEEFYRENGIQFAPSAANFHLLKAPNLYEFMKARSILIRPRSDPPGTVRVSIGTKEDAKKYIAAFY